MDDIQSSSSPKSKMANSFRLRYMCCILETNLTRKFAVDLSLQIFLIHYISSYGYDSGRQFGNFFSVTMAPVFGAISCPVEAPQ